MAKRKYHLSEHEANAMKRAFQQTKDGPTRTRYQAVRMYGLGYAVPEIQEITGCSPTSLMEGCRAYRAQGIAALVDKRHGGNRAKLGQAQIEAVRARLHHYTPRDLFGPRAHTPSGQYWTVEDLAQAVQQWYGVRWDSRTSYHARFARCGFTYQRVEKVYKSRRPSAVDEFAALLEKN